jgi:uncharacterized protein (PEP-CTERM system associated)
LAQTVDKFLAPQIAPQNPNSGAGTSSLYGQLLTQSATSAPPWILTENVGVDEITSDNVGFSSVHRQPDLGSLFSAGGILTADSVRVTGILALTGVYRRQIEDTALNHFSAYGYANEEITLLPGSLYLGLRGHMDEVYRVGLGLQNVLAQASTLTQVYQVSASPLYYIQVDDLTFNLLRYEIGQVVFSNNTGPINFHGQVVPGISDSTDHILRDDFRMDGTVFQRLLTDVSLSGASYNSGSHGVGDFMRDRGQIINAYALTRSLALIGAAGYERLHDRDFPHVDGQDATWSAGLRFLPNADSYALLTYGRNDLRSDFAGELAWSITPLTSLYMDYTDFVTTLAEQSIANINASQIGPFGAVTHVVFDQSPVLNTIDDPLLSGPPGPENPTMNLGVPLADINGTLPLTNGLFAFKALRARVNATIEDSVVALTLLNIDQTPLARPGLFTHNTLISQRAILQLYHFLSPEVRADLEVNFERQSEDHSASSIFTSTDQYGTTLALNWRMSERFDGILRYDFVYSKSRVNVYENTLTIGLYRSFD